MEAAGHRSRIPRPEPVPHDPGPHPAGGPELGDLLEEFGPGREEEAESRREVVDREAAGECRLDVGDRIGEREGELLGGGGPRLAHVVSADRDRVPFREVPGTELEDVRDQPHRRRRWIDPGPAGHVFLEDVVLDRAGHLGAGHALAFGRHDVEGHEGRGGGVDRHRRRYLAERDPVEQDLHVGKARDRNAYPADLTGRIGRIGIEAHLGRQVKGDGQPRLALLEEVAEAGVRLCRRGKPGVLAHRPEAASVHRGLDTAREGELTRTREILVLVQRDDIGRGVQVANLDPR